MKSFDYLFINDWMFELFDNDKKSFDYAKLMIYSYIYSFSRDGKSSWYGKESDLAKLLRMSEKSVSRKLNELLNDGFITRKELDSSKGYTKRYSYMVDLNKISRETTCPITQDNQSYAHETTSPTHIYNKSNNINQYKYTNNKKVGISINPMSKLSISF